MGWNLFFPYASIALRVLLTLPFQCQGQIPVSESGEHSFSKLKWINNEARQTERMATISIEIEDAVKTFAVMKANR